MMNPYLNSMQNQMMYNPQYQRTQPTQNNITWVQGVEGAKAWQMMPNSNAILMDSENEGIFYIKTTDNVGMGNMRVFKYEEVTQQPKQNDIDLSDYVKKSELEVLLNTMLGGGNNEQPVSADDRKIITE